MSLLLHFQGGAVANPASNEQAIADIVDSLGLGLGQYVGEKKVEMLADPLAYLRNRNTALKGIANDATTEYTTTLSEIAQAVSGAAANDPATTAAKNLLWVKRLAAETAQDRLKAKLIKIDVQYPIKDEAFRAQKSKNKRELEEKKKQVQSGAQ